MSFSSELAKVTARIQQLQQEHFANVASAALQSIRVGSPLTGSPGQPVDEGTLIDSWQLTFPEPGKAMISTSVGWAPPNEDGINNGRPYIQRSPKGGRHSVKLTAANIQNIVNDEAQKLA